MSDFIFVLDSKAIDSEITGFRQMANDFGIEKCAVMAIKADLQMILGNPASFVQCKQNVSRV
ncbi:hypothetical protein AAIH70_00005 [Neorhizobium sp. BT27B]|uniref:hypothetical protein n=1 Tax=Neorhizobium sp. BT27B TaxID=3142625 RepID=UPI003D2AD850